MGIFRPQGRETLSGFQIADAEEDVTEQHGQFLLVVRPAKPERRALDSDVTLQVRDVLTMTPLWTQPFLRERPSILVDAPNETMALQWDVTDEAAKSVIRSDTSLRDRLATLRNKVNVYFVQILDARTGRQRGRLLMEADKDSFTTQILVAGDWVVGVDSNEQISVYALTNGHRRDKLVGQEAAVVRTAGLLCVKSNDVRLTVYEISTMQGRAQFTFSSPVSFARFSDDGQRLFVLTKNQNTYVLDVSSLRPSP
jgi:hypothetical protein